MGQLAPSLATIQMSSILQTIIALALVAVAAGWLIYLAARKKSSSGCAGAGCSAVSPEIKKIRAKLKR
jgi:hypothetical protein